MASNIHIDDSQLGVLEVDLSTAATSSPEKVARAIAKTAHDIEADAKALAPVDTGNLKNSISTDVNGMSAEVGPTAEYGRYVEEGTSRNGPQPYLRPAFDRRLPALLHAIADDAEKL